MVHRACKQERSVGEEWSGRRGGPPAGMGKGGEAGGEGSEGKGERGQKGGRAEGASKAWAQRGQGRRGEGATHDWQSVWGESGNGVGAMCQTMVEAKAMEVVEP